MNRAMMWLFAVTCVVYGAVTIRIALLLPPGPGPTHWSGFGAQPADGWSSRNGAITFLVVVGAAMAVLFGGILWWIGRSTSLSGMNIPHKDYWARPENLPEARRRMSTDLGLFGAVFMVFLTASGFSILQASQDPQGRSPLWFGPVFGMWVLAVIAWTLWMWLYRWRIPTGRRR